MKVTQAQKLWRKGTELHFTIIGLRDELLCYIPRPMILFPY